MAQSAANNTAWVDVAFRVVGERLPIDHGYSLYAALSKTLPALHGEITFGTLPVRGTPQAPGWLQLGSDARLTLRMQATDIPRVVTLAGQGIEVDGVRLTIGVPEIRTLRPSAVMASRIVTIKGFADDPAEFGAACRRQLDAAGVEDTASLDVGPRRVMRVREYTVVGFGVRVANLSPQASLTLQQLGIGGKRKMGAGVFIPIAES